MAELPSPAEIRAAARELVNQALRAGPSSPGSPRGNRELVNEADVIAARDKGGVLIVPENALVTPLARDAAERFQVEIRFGQAPQKSAVAAAETPEGAEPSPRDQGGTVAVGSDHGGFKVKEFVKKHLESLGFQVADVGTTSEAACDYPDFAARVGRAVSLGEARWGVFVDGAGIGGAMVLNKVPGVFAATCHDPKAAQNARGHNGANVLCLGSGWVDADKARAVIDAFFSTGFEGGRHLRRVQKIHAVERAFVGRSS
jgi:ribose 5-phosphate isomerase B